MKKVINHNLYSNWIPLTKLSDALSARLIWDDTTNVSVQLEDLIYKIDIVLEPSPFPRGGMVRQLVTSA